VIVQGWGNVASAAALYLAHQGARIVGIIDRAGGCIRQEGYSFEEIKSLFIHKNGNQLNAPDSLSFEEVNEQIWETGAEIFIPGAASKLVSRQQAETLVAHGLEVISCGANVPFEDDGIFFGPTAVMLDDRISLIPDFIANCGMARVFAYFMEPGAEMTDEAVFGDVSRTIRKALREVKDIHPEPVRLSQTALHIALEKLMDKEARKEAEV
jgi:glutamate dehydrogenase/leucine dehydrogenase